MLSRNFTVKTEMLLYFGLRENLIPIPNFILKLDKTRALYN